jgi:hypothetical protein
LDQEAGWDIARALSAGSHDVTAVEINGIIAGHDHARALRGAEQQSLFASPRFTSTGRMGVASSAAAKTKYQVLQATLVDTWAATAAGAFALSENNLYTSDAFQDYLLHLTDDGMVAIHSMGLDPPRESLRLIFACHRSLEPSRREGAVASYYCHASGDHTP